MAQKWKGVRVEVTLPIQIRRILCPIDFSDHSRRALDHAIAMARWYGASLSILHVHQLSMPVCGVPYVGPEGLEPIILTDLERQELCERLDAYVAADREATNLVIDTVLDEATNVPEAILSHAHTASADLIVLGTHGRSGFRRFVLGSIAEKVLRRACSPVLTVPPHVSGAIPRDIISIQRILCPVDFSRSSDRALKYAASVAREARGQLTVLNVLELPPDLTEFPHSGLAEYRNARFQQARKRLSDVVKAAVPATCPVEQLLLVGRSYQEILRVAGEQDTDLIVMGVQGRGAVDLAFFGSTTNHVVRAAECPVLTLRQEPGR